MNTIITFSGIDSFLKPFHDFFHREEARDLAEHYLTGLIMTGERKSVEPMSERVNASERSMQRLLSDVKWEEEGVAALYRQTMLEATSDPGGILIFDDTGFPKKGKDSVCVARQYSGSLGKTDNCQVGVSMSYVGKDIAWPYAMKLFMPESWDQKDDATSQAMRKKTKIPEIEHHQAKWLMALDMLDLARKDHVPHRLVLADGWYGTIPDFRQGLNDRCENYIVGVYSNTYVFFEAPVFETMPVKENKRGRPRTRPIVYTTETLPVKLSEIGSHIADSACQHLELRLNSKDKPLMVDAVSMRVWPSAGWRQGNVAEEVWLLIERRAQIDGGCELRYFFSNLPSTLPTLELARLYHERFWIEQGYQQLKEELGLDHHEGRSWTGWHRHVLLVFMAYGYLSLLQLQEKKRLKAKMWKDWLGSLSILESEYFD